MDLENRDARAIHALDEHALRFKHNIDIIGEVLDMLKERGKRLGFLGASKLDLHGCYSFYNKHDAGYFKSIFNV